MSQVPLVKPMWVKARICGSSSPLNSATSSRRLSRTETVLRTSSRKEKLRMPSDSSTTTRLDRRTLERNKSSSSLPRGVETTSSLNHLTTFHIRECCEISRTLYNPQATLKSIKIKLEKYMTEWIKVLEDLTPHQGFVAHLLQVTFKVSTSLEIQTQWY